MTALGLPAVAGVLAAMVGCGVAGLVLYLLAARPMLASRSFETRIFIATIGIGAVLENVILRLFRPQPVAQPLNVGGALVEQIRRTRAAGGRVIGVGTTVVRALESATRHGAGGRAELAPFAGETRLFILPGYRISSVDAMVTNFHLPQSTLLMMISAFAGRERVFAAYRHAIAARYRFFSYGDAMLLWRASQADAA